MALEWQNGWKIIVEEQVRLIDFDLTLGVRARQADKTLEGIL